MKILGKLLSVPLAVLLFSTAVYAQETEEISVPPEVAEISEELGARYNICPELIQAICWKESRFQADAENGGCVGIMQIAPKWHKDRMDRLGVTDLKDMRQNMTVGIDYLAELTGNGADIAEALMRYHGESDVKERLARCEVSEYAESILKVSAELEKENGK